MSEKYILAINQSTSGTKAIIYNGNAGIVAKGAVEVDTLYPQPGFVEQDAEAIYQSVLRALRQCLNMYQRTVRTELDDIQVCGITTQRETFVLWDEAGTPLHRAIAWQCKRSVEICEKIKGTGLEEEIVSRTGLIVDPYFSATKIKWLYENVAKVREAIDSGTAFGGTIDAWLLYKLTAGKSFFTDYTNASRTLLFNLKKLAWDSVLLRKFGLSNLRLPEPKPSAFDFGETTFNGLFAQPIKIVSLSGDSHAAAFGEACFAPGDAKVTLGTGASILMNTGDQAVPSKNGLVTTICWCLPDRTDYALEGIIVTAGGALKWMRDQLGLFTHVKETEALANGAADNGGVYLVPAFSGLGAPHWKMSGKALITGLTFNTDKNHIVRAALESIAYQLKDVLAVIQKEADVALKELNADGSLTSNNFMMQFIADLLNANVRSILTEDVAALGAAYMAGLHSGIFSNLEELQEIGHAQRRFVPGDKRELVQGFYKGWLAAVKLVK